MLKKNCLLDIKEAPDGLLVRITGEIDHHSAVAVRSEIDEKISALRPLKMVLDMSDIDFMDSSGLGLIMGRYQRMRAVGGELILQNPNQRVLKISKLAGLEKIVKIEMKENEYEA